MLRAQPSLRRSNAVVFRIVKMESTLRVETIALRKDMEDTEGRLAASFAETGYNAVKIIVYVHALLPEGIAYPGIIHHRIGIAQGEHLAFFFQGTESVKPLHRELYKKFVESILNIYIAFCQRTQRTETVIEFRCRNSPCLQQEELSALGILVQILLDIGKAEAAESIYATLPFKVYHHSAKVENYCFKFHIREKFGAKLI